MTHVTHLDISFNLKAPLQGPEGRVNDLGIESSGLIEFIGRGSLNSRLGSSSAMGVLSRRRFLNLIVAGCSPGVKSLRRINLLAQLFHRDTPPPPPPSKTTEMETLRLPRPSFTLRALNNGT